MPSVRNNRTLIFFSIPIFLLFGFIVTIANLRSVESSSTTFSSNPTKQKPQSNTNTYSNKNMTDIRMVFSDVDGTLVHYPDSIPWSISDSDHNPETNKNRILRLPPSATGMQGIISSRTLALCRDLRKRGIPLVLVSGMRTSTLLKRLPFLPAADAYCSEAGGRIFLLQQEKKKNRGVTDTTTPLLSPNKSPSSKLFSFSVTPESLEGFTDDTTTSTTEEESLFFDIVEDLEWRQQMEDEQAAGVDGYAGVELDMFHQSTRSTSTTIPSSSPTIPIAHRKGRLWDFARQLMEKGYVLDTKGYASCFRVNRKQQTSATADEDFERLLRGEVLPCPPELATSTNLGCIDYYPVASGKKNW